MTDALNTLKALARRLNPGPFGGVFPSEAAEISLNCNVNAATLDGRSPLYVAAQEGHDAAVVQLLKAKADIAQATHGGKTALHASIEGSELAV